MELFEIIQNRLLSLGLVEKRYRKLDDAIKDNAETFKYKLIQMIIMHQAGIINLYQPTQQPRIKLEII